MNQFHIVALAASLSIAACVSGCGDSAPTPAVGGGGGSSSGAGGAPSPGTGANIDPTSSGGNGTAGTSNPAETGGGGALGMGGTGTAAGGGAGPSDDPDSGEGTGGTVNMEAGPPIDGSSTEAILRSKSADCLACAQTNGCLDPTQAGGTCEIVPGNAPSGRLTETALCLKTLTDIVSSQCDALLLQTACLCGEISTEDCLSGTVDPIGVARQDYMDDFGTDINNIMDNFEMSTFGAGQANVIVDCVGYYGCHCLGD